VILDTNILLRLIDGGGSPRYDEVRARLESALELGERLVVTAATIHEVVFVLRSTATGYGYSRTETAGEIHELLDAPELRVEHADALRSAATDFGAHQSIDFHDFYLAARARTLDEKVYSLDRDFRRM
jgi:predicted nucleic acid-binding protein